MPRFPVNFRRKSTVAEEQNGPVEPSFRVLERNDAGAGKSFDGGARMVKGTRNVPRTTLSEVTMEDNLFVDIKNNRGSGGSNTTKTASDNSSRHSNASTAPSSTDYAAQEEWRNSARKPQPLPEVPAQPTPKASPGGFLRQAGRTFSFGGTKKTNLPTIPADDPVPSLPDEFEPKTPGGRSRAQTASTVTTATPPKVEDRDFVLDLGGDLSNMLSAFSKRTSVLMAKDESGQAASTSRNLTGNRASHPSPLHLDQSSTVEPPPRSWNSQHSNEELLGPGRMMSSPPPVNGNMPPAVPRHNLSLGVRSRSDEDDEESRFLKDSLAATRFLSGGTAPAASGSSRSYRRAEDSITSLKDIHAKPSRFDPKPKEDNMFDTSFARSKLTPRAGNRPDGQPQNKVMTPAEFERYRQDKARQSQASPDHDDSDNEDEENYEEEQDDRERTMELARQRRKQEAHMTVYRQQMMKVTGEQQGIRPNLPTSISTPNLPSNFGAGPSGSNSPPSDGSEDEEVPLAILAAHGFPNKNRPPTRLSTMASNPNLRASMNQPSYTAGPGSVAGDNAQNTNGRLPAFARKLPQDPFLGSSLVNHPPRESFALAGGSPAAMQNRAAPVGGLVGVIANEERQRAMRRGSPAVDNAKNSFPPQMQMPNGGFDPAAGIPPQMMYPMAMPQMPMLTPGDQAQIQMTQQMQQFMQMQMQFMQMMTGQNQNQNQMQMQMPGQGAPHPQGHMQNHSMGSMVDLQQNGFMGDAMSMGMSGGPGLEPPRRDSQMRTMSMVQPSSASWIQPPQPGYTPSIRFQGGGYAPSIAPSERSNIGLPGRYRPVSSMDMSSRTQTMSGSLPTLSRLQGETKSRPADNDDDDDDEQGWEAMKAKREKKKSLWRTKKNYGSDIGALIS